MIVPNDGDRVGESHQGEEIPGPRTGVKGFGGAAPNDIARVLARRGPKVRELQST